MFSVPVHEKFGSNCAGLSRASKGFSLESDVISPKFDDGNPWPGTSNRQNQSKVVDCENSSIHETVPVVLSKPWLPSGGEGVPNWHIPDATG